MKVKIVGAKPMTRRETQKYVRERIGWGMRSAAAFLSKQLKVVVGVQGVKGTRAIPGASPRRITGAGQRSVGWRIQSKNVVLFSALWYMLYWEKHGHPWMRQTIRKYRDQAIKIAGRAAGFQKDRKARI